MSCAGLNLRNLQLYKLYLFQIIDLKQFIKVGYMQPKVLIALVISILAVCIL